MHELVRVLRVRKGWGKATILDPCASSGEAVAILAKGWDLEAYGVELHPERARALGLLVPHAFEGSYTQIKTDEHSVLFLNPPYDYARLDDDTVERQELQFLVACTPHLRCDGLLVFIPPASLLKREDFRTFFAKNYTSVECYRFPDGEFEAFHQVVIVASKRRQWSYYTDPSDIIPAVEDMPILGHVEQSKNSYYLSSTDTASGKFRMSMTVIRPEDIAPQYGEHSTGVWGTRQWELLTGRAAASLTEPLLAPRPGHQAMLLAAGALNGCRVGNFLVKGGSEKVVTTSKKDNDDGDTTVTERERITSHLSVLDLTTGELDTWNVEDNPTKTVEWFKTWSAELAAAIRSHHTPAFNGDITPHLATFATLTPPGKLPGRDKPEWLELQQTSAAAIAFRWKRHKNVVLSGEPGLGKTSIATCATVLGGLDKTVVMCPTHLVEKWVREITIITGRKCAIIGRKLGDIDRFFADPDLHYLVLSKETAKLGARWRHALLMRKRIKSHWFPLEDNETPDPTKGHVLDKGYGWGSSDTWRKRVVERLENFSCPRCGVLIDEPEGKARTQCPNEKCGTYKSLREHTPEALWQNEPISVRQTKDGPKATKRWALASYLAHRYARRYSVVLDEAHQYSAPNSDQARAAARLLASARKTLIMTGTLYGGRATSIFYLLYWAEPQFRAFYPSIKDAKRFAEHHGLFERVYTEDEHTSKYGYRRGGKSMGGKVREIPGMSPAMIPLLLPYTIFVKLKDLDIALPPYSEQLERITPDKEVAANANKLASECLSVLRKHPECLGAYLMACLGYPDLANDEEIIGTDRETNTTTTIAYCPGVPHATYPKDDRVVQIALQERSAGRGVLVYTSQNQRRDVRPRLKARLEAEGLRVVILEPSVAPDKREEWVRDQWAKGFDVMITNGKLVETGLDLMWAHTIILYGTEYSINTLRQMLHRSWRVGQTKPIKVIVLAYEGTMQIRAAELIAKKMAAAEMVDGDEVGGLGQTDTSSTNLLFELAQTALAYQ